MVASSNMVAEPFDGVASGAVLHRRPASSSHDSTYRRSHPHGRLMLSSPASHVLPQYSGVISVCLPARGCNLARRLSIPPGLFSSSVCFQEAAHQLRTHHTDTYQALASLGLGQGAAGRVQRIPPRPSISTQFDDLTHSDGSIGWSEIDCFILDAETVSREEAEMWEISENLHRAELTVLQRSEQVARWVELADKLAQLAPVSKGGRGKEGGERKAARELDIDRDQVRRAKKIASLSPEAKDAAQETGLADNQSALLEAAKMPVSEQAKAIRKRAESAPSRHPQDDMERSLKWRRSFEKCWNAAPSTIDREWALQWVDRPIMDGSRAA